MSNSLRVSAWNACVSSRPSETTEEAETEARAEVVIPLPFREEEEEEDGDDDDEEYDEYDLDPCDQRRGEAVCGSR